MVQGAPDFSVVLNPNAKGVTPAIVTTVQEVIPPDKLFLTSDVSDNARLAEQFLKQGVEKIFVGGGDGTIVSFVNALLSVSRDLGDLEIPKVGVMRLGTGNAVAELVSSGSYLADLRSFIQNPHEDVYTMRWLDSEGRLFPFGGIGLDAELLNDYEWVKEVSSNTAISPAFTNVGGYFAALFSRTIPRKMKGVVQPNRVKLKVTNGKGRAWFMGHDGTRAKEFAPGEVMYEGEMLCAITGTCPYYGYGLKVLPYAAEDSELMNIRIVNTPLQIVLANLRTVWDGTYRHDQMFDFLAEDVRFATSVEVPYQEAGDAMGMREQLRIRVSPQPIRLIRFI